MVLPVTELNLYIYFWTMYSVLCIHSAWGVSGEFVFRGEALGT